MARCTTCHRRVLLGRACPQHGGAAHVPAPAGSGEGAAGEVPPAWSRPLGGRVGRGGFASVWEVLGGGAVLKVAHADHELARARLRREAEALAAIGAPAVPRLDGEGVLPDGRAWLAMERIGGTNLGELLAEGPLRIEHAIAIAAAILDALARVHAAGFAHRDLKPDNLIRRPNGTIAILDLGLARRLAGDPDDPTRAGVQVGSLEYMPPEQLADARAASARSDLYAFGCVLYELCAGRPPFVGDAAVLERAHAALRPPPLGALAGVSPSLEQLCHECLAKQPARRPASADDARARLHAIASEAAALRRTPRSRSVVGAGKQPVVLIWVELPRVDRALLGMLASRKFTIVSQRGRRVLGAVVGAEHVDPAAAAIAAGRDLAAAGARVALHLDALEVNAQPDGVTLIGAGVERPEAWVPETPWTGVVLTRAFATVTRTRTRATDVGTGFVRLGEPDEPAHLFGRDVLVSDLAADAAAALAGAGPGLVVLVGEPGVGKTSIARALVPMLKELDARVVESAVPPPGSGRPPHAALADLVGSRAGPVVRVVGDAVRAAARVRPTAILIDDLHLADHELLDALEYATLGGEPLPLWVLGIASPRLDHRRPGFGARAERRRREVVPPLDEDAAVALAVSLLRPAEYPPLRALRQLAGIARGNPLHLASLAKEIHDRGAIRRRPNGEFFLDTTALDAIPQIALGPWLAARELAGLSAELVALARVCAVLGGDFCRAELAAVVEAAERAGGATTTVDVDVGLAELTAAGVLVATAGEAEPRCVFPLALLEDGIYATTNPDERRALHAAALAYWRERAASSPASAARIARHAEAVGDRAAAAAAFAVLGADAHARHRPLEADQAWQGALRNLDDGDPARGRALLGRARARCKLQRSNEAAADLAEVVALAAAAGDAVLELEAELERALVADWDGRFGDARAATARAHAIAAGFAELPGGLASELALADARDLFRAHRYADAIPRLRAVIEAARGAGRVEVETVARTLLGPCLVDVGALDDAEAAFDALVAQCERTDDKFHLGVAYANRAWLWSARRMPERSAEDQRLVIQLAREAGQAQIERVGTYNLAEELLWRGAYDEALALARRCVALQLGPCEASAALDRVLVARILAARGARAELAEALAALAEETSNVELEAEVGPAIVAALHAVADGAGAARWREILASSAAPADGDDGANSQLLRLEIAALAARAGCLTGRERDDILALAQDDPVFAARIGDF